MGASRSFRSQRPRNPDRAQPSVQIRARADDVERGATRARELARPRRELPTLDPLDRRRELGLELRQLVAGERRRDKVVRALEELVDDLGLLRAGAEAR